MLSKPAGNFCDIDCMMGYAKDKSNLKRLVKVGRKEADKHFAKQKREFRLNDKSIRMKAAVTAFNKFIRLSQANEPCISCQRKDKGQYHAGHYMPAGINSALKFTEDNCWLQCAQCNNNLSGNLTNYRIHLIEKIGLKTVEELENNKEVKRWTCEELKEIETIYKSKIKDLERSIAA